MRATTEAAARMCTDIEQAKADSHDALYTVLLPTGWCYEPRRHCRVVPTKEEAETARDSDPIEPCKSDCHCFNELATFACAPTDWPTLVPPDQGWMSELEVACIGWAALVTAAAHVAGDLLEIGAYKGRTTSALAVAGRVTVVDTFLGGGSMAEVDSYPEFAANIQSRDVTVCRGDSRQIVPELSGPFRVIVVDGDHEEETAYADLVHAWSKLSVGGYLFIDDINYPSIVRAMDRWASELKYGEMAFTTVTPKLGMAKRLSAT